jgi:hypothetical protein
MEALSIVIQYWIREENKIRHRLFLEAHIARRARVIDFYNIQNLRLSIVAVDGDTSSIDYAMDMMKVELDGCAIGVCKICGNHIERIWNQGWDG